MSDTIPHDDAVFANGEHQLSSKGHLQHPAHHKHKTFRFASRGTIKTSFVLVTSLTYVLITHITKTNTIIKHVNTHASV